MITVKYWAKEMRMTVEGHATNAQLEGDPCVCAAVSALVYSLMNTLDAFIDKKWAKCAYFENGDGMAYMRAKKIKWHKFKAVRVAFGMTLGGLAMIAKTYPEMVKVQVVSGEFFDDAAAIKAALEKA